MQPTCELRCLHNASHNSAHKMQICLIHVHIPSSVWLEVHAECTSSSGMSRCELHSSKPPPINNNCNPLLTEALVAEATLAWHGSCFSHLALTT